jgi:hypothetical protein
MGVPLIPIPHVEAGAAQRIKITKGDSDKAKSIAPDNPQTGMSDKEVAHYNRPGIRVRGGGNSDYSAARDARKD